MTPGTFQVTLKLLLWRDGRFLVLRDRLSGQADLPGGRIGEAERLGPWTTPLRRELAEELGAGVACDLDDQPVWAYGDRIGGRPSVGLIFHGTWREGEPALSDEHEAMAWLAPGEPPPWPFPTGMGEAVQGVTSTVARGTNLRATAASTARACTSSDSPK